VPPAAHGVPAELPIVRVVIDANVWVSAAIRTGPAHRIMQRWLAGAGDFEVIICHTLIAEVEDVLTDDDYLVALARERGADFIVTGDNDLLDWAEQRPPVITPAAFEELLGPT
jgi:predicted nucleic acid-binding protein